MDYRILASANDAHSYVITNEENLRKSLAIVRKTHPDDHFLLLDDGPAANLIDTIGTMPMVDALLDAVGFYMYETVKPAGSGSGSEDGIRVD